MEPLERAERVTRAAAFVRAIATTLQPPAGPVSARFFPTVFPQPVVDLASPPFPKLS
jgi:hypothetical protein